MKQPSVYLKMRVLGAVDTVEGRTRHERSRKRGRNSNRTNPEIVLFELRPLFRRLAGERGRTPWQLLGGMMNVAWLLLESLRRDAWAACWFEGSGLRGVHVSFQPFDTS